MPGSAAELSWGLIRILAASFDWKLKVILRHEALNLRSNVSARDLLPSQWPMEFKMVLISRKMKIEYTGLSIRPEGLHV